MNTKIVFHFYMLNNVENKSIVLDAENENPVVKFFKSIFKRKPSLDARKARAGYMFVAPFIIGVLLLQTLHSFLVFLHLVVLLTHCNSLEYVKRQNNHF